LQDSIFPFTYLRIAVGVIPKKEAIWNSIVEKKKLTLDAYGA